jgi:endonuclease YncB( thermonuclease family)
LAAGTKITHRILRLNRAVSPRKYSNVLHECIFNLPDYGCPMNIIALVLLGWALLLAQPTYADFTGKVVKVADGDTITVLRDSEQIKIRLAGIDAPEKAQPFGNVAKQSMSEMLFGKEVRVIEQGPDRYGRTIGRVYQGDVDVSAEQIKQGMAWVYRKYTKKAALYQLEDEAKQQRLGLWADAEPTPPWVWRRMAR